MADDLFGPGGDIGVVDQEALGNLESLFDSSYVSSRDCIPPSPL